MSLVKIGPKRHVVIPAKVCTRLGLAAGDYVEIAVEGTHGVIKPRKKSATVDEPLGPKALAAVRAGLRDVASGRTSKSLKTAQEVQSHLDRLKL